MDLNLNTLPKIISKEANSILNDFIEDIHCMVEHITLLDIADYILHHKEDYYRVCDVLGKELNDYSDICFENELNGEGEDFLIQYIQKTILEDEWAEWKTNIGI